MPGISQSLDRNVHNFICIDVPYVFYVNYAFVTTFSMSTV